MAKLSVPHDPKQIAVTLFVAAVGLVLAATLIALLVRAS